MKIISIYIRFLFQRFLILIGLMSIAIGAYLCKVNQASFGLLNLICNFFNEDKPQSWLYLIEYLIFVFIFICIVILILISYYKDYKNNRRNIRKKYIDLFVKSIFSYLYAETSSMPIKREFLYKLWRELRSDYAKRLYINLLRQIYLETEGEVNERLICFVDDLKYDSFIKAYFLSPFIRNNLFALKTVKGFRIQGYEKYIVDLLRKNDKLTRSAALTTLIQFEKYNDLLFLVENQVEISKWEINLIVKSLPISSKDKIQYKALIASNLKSLSTLGIILANLNEKKELKKDIKTKIIYDDYDNEEAVLAYTSFAEYMSDFDSLISIFKATTEIAKIQILKALLKCPNKALITDFLEQVVKTDSYPLKIAAIQSLLQVDMLFILRLKKSEDLAIRQACNQVLDFNM